MLGMGDAVVDKGIKRNETEHGVREGDVTCGEMACVSWTRLK